MNILHIQSSPRAELSSSIELTNAFVEVCQSANEAINVDTLNVWNENLPEFDYEAIGAKYKAIKRVEMTAKETEVWKRIQSLIKRFQKADRIIVGTPMWNFGVPYKLKQLIIWLPSETSSSPMTARNTGRRSASRRLLLSTLADLNSVKDPQSLPRASITRLDISISGLS